MLGIIDVPAPGDWIIHRNISNDRGAVRKNISAMPKDIITKTDDLRPSFEMYDIPILITMKCKFEKVDGQRE